MIINVREFRKYLAKYLDLAEKETIEIQRRDIIIAKLVGVHKEIKPNEVYTPPTEVDKEVYTKKTQKFPPDKCQRCGADWNKFGFCTNGHKRN